MSSIDHESEIDAQEEEIDFEDLLALDAIEPTDAAKIARDITVAWVQGNKYEDNLTEEEVAIFFKSMYQAVRFPTLIEEDDLDDDDDDEADGDSEKQG
ncbi:MAG: hypothetical protein EB084_02505 [Proteobacteria bacterium]|nr:hypothetical protein [Pseudomonadota bacterium]